LLFGTVAIVSIDPDYVVHFRLGLGEIQSAESGTVSPTVEDVARYFAFVEV
jgi:hypothetical protein